MKPEYRCKYCGAPSWLPPIDQAPPPDYCHESDHGEPPEPELEPEPKNAQGVDPVQPWPNTKSEARQLAAQLGIELKGEPK